MNEVRKRRAKLAAGDVVEWRDPLTHIAQRAVVYAVTPEKVVGDKLTRFGGLRGCGWTTTAPGPFRVVGHMPVDPAKRDAA